VHRESSAFFTSYQYKPNLRTRIVNIVNNRYGKVEQFTLSLYEINTALAKEDDMKPNIHTIVLPEYYDYLKIFEKANTEKLPLHCLSDHGIPVMDRFKPPFGPLYSLSHPKLKELKCWLDENLSTGFIPTSSSPTATPILFVTKGDSSLRLVVNYRDSNEGTIKNRYPLPLLQDTLMNLSKAKWFMKLDICRVYNLIHIAEGVEWKTTFCTHYSLFKSLLILFSLTNAPVIFQNYINDILVPYVDYFCTTYPDNTLIYSDNFKEHQQYVHLVLDAFAKVGLYLKPKKCEFHEQEVKYLGLIISTEGIKMDYENICTVQDWEPPSNLKDIYTFLGFANFYRHFIHNYSHIVQALTFLTHKGVLFAWSMEQQTAFNTLKATFTLAPILAHFDPD
jgi:hypothetical protein